MNNSEFLANFMVKRALFSLYNTDKAVNFAEDLVKMGWEIICSNETFRILQKRKIPVKNISIFTRVKKDYGFPSTLHPKIEYYLTSNNKKERIDLVYIINYPLSAGNDVGGMTLLALAAKGNRIPVMSSIDMELVINDFKNYGEISHKLHSELLEKTNALISNHYFSLIKEKMNYDAIFGKFQFSLINGENPYQVPAMLFSTEADDRLSLNNFKQLSGEPPCFTNLADCDSILYTMCLCAEAFKLKYNKIPHICIASKHGNPCGMAIDWHSPLIAVKKALFGNPRAIWGGEVITNFEINSCIANILFKSRKREKKYGKASWMLDIVIAPHFTKESIKILGTRRKRKLFQNRALLFPFLTHSKYSYRFVRGGFLRQPPSNYILNLAKAEFTGKKLKKAVIDSLIIAWATAYSSNHGGNEVAIAKDRILLSCGGGPSTVEAAHYAIIKAKNLNHKLSESVFAADAFFPFIDAPELLIKHGINVGVVPSGGKEMDKIRSFFKRHHGGIYYLPEEYRGFCRH